MAKSLARVLLTLVAAVASWMPARAFNLAPPGSPCMVPGHACVPPCAATLPLRPRKALRDRAARMAAADGEFEPLPPRLSTVKVSSPSAEEGVQLGIREWPGFLKKTADFEEEVEAGATRYIMDGLGTCTPEGEAPITLEPGTLLECTSSTTLSYAIYDSAGQYPIKGNPQNYPLIIVTPDVQGAPWLLASGLAFLGGLALLVANASDTGSKQQAKRARPGTDDEDEE